jgi:hypothetical protein
MANCESELRRIHVLRSWQERLQEIEPVFAQLIFVARLRDISGNYVHADLRKVFSLDVCHQILSRIHRELFIKWLSMSARDRLRDLRKYNETLCSSAVRARETDWQILCRELVPSGVSITELALFFETMEKMRCFVIRDELSSAARPLKDSLALTDVELENSGRQS